MQSKYVAALLAFCVYADDAGANVSKQKAGGSAHAVVVEKLDKAASVNAFCTELVDNIPELQMQQCREAGFKPGKSKSSQGRPLMVRDFAPTERMTSATSGALLPGNRPPRVLLIGGIHGDEHAAISVVFQWIERLKDDRHQPMVWRVLPCVNPDGTLAQPSTRTNAHQVDLNRNFPSPDWNAQAMKEWKHETKSDPRRYPGPRAASEPETRWLMQQIKEFKPDAIVSVHAPLNLLDFDGPREPPDKLGFLRLEPIGVYPGSLGNYAGRHLGMPVFTMELPRAIEPPSAAQSERVLTDLQLWLTKNFVPAHERG